MDRLNREIFFKLYGLSSGNEKWGRLAVALSKSAEVFFFTVFGIGALIILLFGRYGLLLRYLAVPFATLVYNTFMRKILGRPRPFNREENVKSLTGHKDSSSCPSNHAASAMVIAMAWYCIFPQVSLLLVIPAVFTGLSRVMTGEHYPFDVLLGWTIGLAAGVLGFVIKY